LPLHELQAAQWDKVMATNLRGPFLLSREAILHMKPRDSGHILNITSTAAKRAWPNAGAYHASKWGLLGLSHAMHAELRPHGIKVTAVVAGGMRTPFLLERFPDIDQSTLQDPATVAAAIIAVLCLPDESVVPEISVLPMKETSWP
ncbi:MAG: SDR family oxidoreductase, partial [Zoogloea sp.]|nr:SDR family oxidoreductase [Zoogloea sp.]